MKNLSLILNIVLLLAVGYLYYYDFSGKKARDVAEKISRPYSTNDSGSHRPVLAYVDLDSLNSGILFMKEKKKELEAEAKEAERIYEDGIRKLQAERDAFVKRGATVSDAEAQRFSEKLISEQQLLENKKQQKAQELNTKSFDIMEVFRKRLKDFLAEYNTNKNYLCIFTVGSELEYMVYRDSSLNITADVIKGLNEKWKPASKQ
ncbi:MAG TPA: OmpH family outer membrane protein [Ferruginibacter sp.]|nr:OmpH family outer membrane protein [Ferruginibacter sp.]